MINEPCQDVTEFLWIDYNPGNELQDPTPVCILDLHTQELDLHVYSSQ